MTINLDESPSTSQVLLIDLENCPNQLKQLQQNLDDFTQVIICYAQSSAKIPLDWLTLLNQAMNTGKLKLIKMPSSGKNAADFGICFFAGTLMAKLSEDTHFVIISNDTDLDHVVELLIDQGRTAERVGYKLQKEETETIEPSALTSESIKYCSSLITYSKNRPGKKETLLNSIKSALQIEREEAESIFDNLLAEDIIKLSGAKITYNAPKIKKIVAQKSN